MKNIWHNNLGLSFLEIMVSISIMIMVLSLTVVNYRSANKRTEIIMWADKLVSDIRLMENNALAVRTFNDDSTRNIWGIYLDNSTTNNNHYILYNNSNNDFNFDAGETFRDIILPNNIIIESIKDDSGADINNCSIVFIPPDPIVQFMDGDTPMPLNKDVTVVLRDTINGSSKEVYINFFGLVEVKN